MKILILLSLVLCLLQGVLLTAAASAGRATAPGALSTWFTDADGTPCVRPCLFGVRLGQSTFTQALETLRQHPAIQDLNLIGRSNAVEKFLTTRHFDIYLRLDGDQRVMQMDLSYLQLSSDATAFGSALGTIGTPDLILGFYDSVTLFSIPFGTRLDVKISGCRVRPAAQIYQVEVVADLPRMIESMALLQPWAGFASTLTYQAQFRAMHPNLYGYWMHRCID